MPQLTTPVVPAGTMARVAQPLLSARELTLRPWQPADVPAVERAYSDPEIQQWHARSMTPTEAEEWIEARAELWAQEGGADWAIIDESGVLGRIGARRIELSEGLAEVTYWVLPNARRRRVASTALRGLSDWLFGELGVHRIELMHSTLNPASCRIAELASFQFEGVKRQEALHADGWHDMHIHARLSGDR